MVNQNFTCIQIPKFPLCHSYYFLNWEPVKRAIMACNSDDAVCVANAKLLINDADVEGSDTIIKFFPLGQLHNRVLRLKLKAQIASPMK